MVKDSGSKEQFETGSHRDSGEGKGWYAHLSPVFLERLAKHTEAGGRKYGPRNWEKGIPLTRCLESAIRHIYEYIEGHRDEDHLTAAAWNLMVAVHGEEMTVRGMLPSSLCDLPRYLPEDKS